MYFRRIFWNFVNLHSFPEPVEPVGRRLVILHVTQTSAQLVQINILNHHALDRQRDLPGFLRYNDGKRVADLTDPQCGSVPGSIFFVQITVLLELLPY